MKLIFCVEKGKGTMFFGKRLSKDSALIQKLLEIVNGAPLWVSSYSASLFEGAENIIIDDDYNTKAENADFCFVEDKGYDKNFADEIILCHWNRKYPADKFFDIDLKKYQKFSSEDIAGSSHDKITIEIYKRG